MWLKVGNGYLNLRNVVDVHFLPDADGQLTATVETVGGGVKHVKGREAEGLRDALSLLARTVSAGESSSLPAP